MRQAKRQTKKPWKLSWNDVEWPLWDFELLMHEDVDAPIIINEYLNITHAFYGGQEAKMVNGVLDSVAKVLR